MEKLVDVTAVEVVGDHRLRLTLTDGVVGEVGVESREWRGVLAPLADQPFLAQVQVVSPKPAR